MNNSFYGLSHNPFDKHSLKVKDFFESNDYRQMLDRLNFLKDVNGIGVFTATPGMGKSYVLRCFNNSLNTNLYQMRYICLSTISVAEFYKQLCEELGLDAKGGKTVMFKAIQERIFYLFKEKRCPLILAVDEAQYLNAGILKDLKMLMNYQYDSLNCFSLILSGEPHLNFTLEKPVNEALKQRITVHYNFAGLAPDEIPEYIKHKISIAGGSMSIFAPDAISVIAGFCHGNPRIIDNLISDALMLGAQLAVQPINADVIMAAANAQTLG
ncbi:MAG: AAA family ATPase [Oscillospiraceae bacterium]|nr:AAA family ATPase [Oscillospiraceae bacterium]